MKVDLSCPIELWAYELPTKANPVCSFTFFNLGRRTISSIQITITCFDALNQVLSRRVERPMALDALGRETFSVEVFTDLAVEAIDLIIDKTWFEDGTEWRRAQEARLVDYKPNELPPNRKLEQLRYIAGPDAVGYPSDQGVIWICVCGRVNATEEKACRRCSRAQEEVFERFSFEAVQRENDRRERELEQKARLAREEASQQEFLRQSRARRKRRNRRIRTGAFCAAIIISGAVYLFVVLGLPEIRYQTAIAAMNSGNPAQARTDFEELSTYRDAPEMINACDFAIAQTDIQSGDLARVEQGIERMTALGSYQGASEGVSEGLYQKAIVLMDMGNYETASGVLSEMKDYRDAGTLYNKSEYSLAMQEMDAKDYEAARARFLSLGPKYSDALARANDCIYLPAKEMMLSEKFEGAAQLFATIKGYSDASAQWQLCVYKSASQAQLSGDYQKAADLFMEVGNYEDAEDWVKNSVYTLANQLRDAEDYELARSLYGNILSYEDAAEQTQACAYLPAEALKKEEQYEEAAALFKEIPGYLDAAKQYGECIVQAAKAAATAKDFEKAIALYEEVAQLEDVGRPLSQARYSYGEQLVEAAQYDEAIALFEALGEYDDSETRVLKTKYAKADSLATEGDFDAAREQFEALEGYSDSEERIKSCLYESAMLSYGDGGGDLAEAYQMFADIEAYDLAAKKAQEIAYALGEQLEEAGDLDGAYQAFDNAGKFNDAEDRRDLCVYKRAQSLMDGGSYQEASALFDSIVTYADARTKRDECYDTWLSIRSMTATDLYQNEEYEEVIKLLADIDMTVVPKAYESIRTMYFDSNLRIAKKLTEEDRALDAYNYLIACKGYKNANELLQKTVYRILGTWETQMGVRYAFFLDGTCIVEGKPLRFKMLNAYGILTGETEEDMKRTFSFTSGGDDSMTLRATDDKIIRLTRVRPPEQSQSDERDGIVVTFLDDEENGDGAETAEDTAEEDVPVDEAANDEAEDTAEG